MADGQTPVVTEGLVKKYRRGWALRDCTLRIPQNRVVALVGPNGAGKSTLMGLVTGLVKPTAGEISVFGDKPHGRGLHPGVAFLAQQKPLYPQFTVAETLRFGQRTNPTWDQEYAERLVRRAQVPLTAKVGTLSGGQRTRVALALALGKRPRLLLLDEPLADLDPLARESVLRNLVEESRRQGITVLLSSHVLAELEGVCDHLVLLADGQVRVAGDVEALLDKHVMLVGPPEGPLPVPASSVIDARRTPDGQEVLVPASLAGPASGWRRLRPRLGHLALGYMRDASREVAA
jgi:ABC-2 type transport system ATP-binding protein